MAFRVCLAVTLLLAGCSSDAKETSPKPASKFSSAPSPKVKRCTDRFVARAEDGASSATLRGYARAAYCEPFARRGWVYADGTLSIAAYTKSATCSVSTADGATRTLPCDRVVDPVLDCALLHLIRRSEVQKYLAKLQRAREVRCDDGTPLEKLGAA